MITVDYDYYKNVWLGVISEDDFNALSIQSAREVHYITIRKNPEQHMNEVLNAICAAIDAAHNWDQNNPNIAPGIKSENTDGYSVTYADQSMSEKHKQRWHLVYQAIARELSGTGLLFRGVIG